MRDERGKVQEAGVEDLYRVGPGSRTGSKNTEHRQVLEYKDIALQAQMRSRTCNALQQHRASPSGQADSSFDSFWTRTALEYKVYSSAPGQRLYQRFGVALPYIDGMRSAQVAGHFQALIPRPHKHNESRTE